MSILACDVGLKRIGLAILKANIILPLAPIIRKNREVAAKQLDSILQAQEIKVLVVGLPKLDESDKHSKPNESISTMQRRIKHFISLLEFSGEVHYINENYSSKEALDSISYMQSANRAKATKDGRLDSLSACVILERYMGQSN